MPNVKTTGKKSSNTLVRDLVNVGIFTALYIVLAFLSSSIGYIPAFIVVSTCSIALVTSIPLFLFFIKIDRPMLCCMLMCGIFGLAMLMMGQGILMLGICLLVGLLTGACLKFSMMLPLWTSTEEYLEYTRTMCDEGYVAHLAELSQSYWPLIGIYSFGVLGAIVGAFIARRVMKKHFERMGLIR